MSFLHGVIFTLTILNIIVHYLRRRKEEEKGEKEEGEGEGEEEYGERGEDSSPSLRHLSCRRFSLDHIRLATNNFDESLVIGEGGFGKVYKVKIDAGADVVAIKRLSLSSSQGVIEFRTELELLSKFRHSHLVSLIGYCEAGREMILVYEYMPAGSLSDHLHKDRRLKSGHSPLSWVQRLNICIDAARGLDYLHTGTSIKERVIHRDVKSSNILLDEHFAAKISDFGLSRIAPVNPRSTNCAYTNRNMGTFGYMDLESFYTRRVTKKSDVYAFGVVLFEALCGRPAVDVSLDEEQCGLAGWAKICVREGTINQIIDPFLRGEILSGCLDEFVKIAYECLHDRSKNRPTMADVVAKLEYALAIQEGRDVVASVESGLVLQEGKNSPVFEQQVANRTRSHPRALHDEHQTAEEDPEVYLGRLKRFSLCELQVATDNFSNENIVGRGGFGKVYKGRLADGSLVAVKRRKEVRTEGGELQFQTEVEMISMAVHRNLLRLQGFCTTPTERLLVYPYMANGSVASCLRERPETQSALDWPIRKRIALGSARGLAYLHDHCDPKIIHRDVKAANILLDDEFEAVVGDFGLAKLMDNKDTHVTTAVRGTIGHIAPEYLSTGKTSEKTDVFGYGVMLLELLTGHRSFVLARFANDEDVMLLDWVKGLLKEKKFEVLVDADLQGFYIDEEVEQLIQVALLCTQDTPMKRPKMSEVVRLLEGYGLTERWEEYRTEEMSRQEFNNTHTPNTDWIVVDSTHDLRSE